MVAIGKSYIMAESIQQDTKQVQAWPHAFLKGVDYPGALFAKSSLVPKDVYSLVLHRLEWKKSRIDPKSKALQEVYFTTNQTFALFNTVTSVLFRLPLQWRGNRSGPGPLLCPWASSWCINAQLTHKRQSNSIHMQSGHNYTVDVTHCGYINHFSQHCMFMLGAFLNNYSKAAKGMMWRWWLLDSLNYHQL